MLRACSPIVLACAALFAADAGAYCVYNGLRDRHVTVVQEEHPERSREPRKLDITLDPGQRQCCNFWNLDCNPPGREDGVVGLRIRIVEEPDVQCGLPGGRYREHQVSVTSTGTLRVMPNHRKSERTPYVVRARTREGKDLSGPAGIACSKPAMEAKPETKQEPK
jgi:hypothetical protein